MHAINKSKTGGGLAKVAPGWGEREHTLGRDPLVALDQMCRGLS